MRDADIVVEASRLVTPAPLLRTEWIKRGALVMPYGTISAVEISLADITDKFLMDDFGQARAGRFGALKPLSQVERVLGEEDEFTLGMDVPVSVGR